jgi:uncharacterized protein (DUF488 family)
MPQFIGARPMMPFLAFSAAMAWRCHRRTITDYLVAAGESVFHILGPGHADEAHMTASAQRQPGGRLIYTA